MSTRKLYKVIGIMSGTSMDALDCSYLETDGNEYVKIIIEKSYKFSKNYKHKLNKFSKNNQKNYKNKYKELDNFVTLNFLRNIKKFINEFKIKKKLIDFIGISGQTIFHDPKDKITIQLGSCKIIKERLGIKVIGNFRNNDIKNGGQGAPIGAFYHNYILKKISINSAIINIGGIANIAYLNKNNLTAYDLGPGNCLIDDLMLNKYNKNFDKDGKISNTGKINKRIINEFEKDKYFNLPIPKSLDRNYFAKYFTKLVKLNKNDSISTAAQMTILSIIKEVKKLDKKVNNIIFTGGGRKNKYIINNIKKTLKEKDIKVSLIDKFNFDGDFLESQAFGYIAVRSYLGLPLSLPLTTGVKKPLTGGKLFI